MKKRGVIILSVIVVVLAGWIAISYNRLVKKEEEVNFRWNEVQSVYQRRLDLIPNVVSLVKGSAEFERTTMEMIAKARASTPVTIDAGSFERQTEVQDGLAQNLNRLIISSEAYPQLQGTRAFSDLQVDLAGTERRIKVARKDFNVAVADYNSSVKSFPTNLIASLLGFPPREGFSSVEGADRAVEIKF